MMAHAFEPGSRTTWLTVKVAGSKKDLTTRRWDGHVMAASINALAWSRAGSVGASVTASLRIDLHQAIRYLHIICK